MLEPDFKMAPLAIRDLAMSTAEIMGRELAKRRTCYRRRYGYISPSPQNHSITILTHSSYTQRYNCNSAWSRFGRWILAGVLIFIGLILLFLILCLSRRRKRRAAKYTSQPATTYNAPQTSTYDNNNTYGVNNGGYAPPAGPPPTNYGGSNAGYYGGQGGVEQPGNTYQPQYK